MLTLDDLRTIVRRRRLGDLTGAIWPDEEIDLQLVNAYQALANDQHVFFDWVYLDLRPRTLTLTQAWELDHVSTLLMVVITSTASGLFGETQRWERQLPAARLGGTDTGVAQYTAAFEADHDPGPIVPFAPLLDGPGWFTNPFEADNGHVATLGRPTTRVVRRDQIGGVTDGVANYTAAWERELARDVADDRDWSGPATSTAPWEFTDGFASRALVDTSLSALYELPDTLTDLVRVTWDKRGTDALEAHPMQGVDSRYEITQGEVYGFLWEKDGLRTLRLVRVPGVAADTITVSADTYGVMRGVTDLTADTVSGSWGGPRCIPGQHPIGGGTYGAGRRPYLDTHNVRVEHFRHGTPLDHGEAVCELPDRYAVYLVDYAAWKCLLRNGPGQDVVLAEHFHQRWIRNTARVAQRIDGVDREETIVLGGDGVALTTRPPRPKLPWAYGSVVK